jgi:hypothetical protein
MLARRRLPSTALLLQILLQISACLHASAADTVFSPTYPACPSVPGSSASVFAAIVHANTCAHVFYESLQTLTRCRGIQVHPHTFRNEAKQIEFTFTVSARAEYSLFFNGVGIHGAFTDFPRHHV